MKAVTDKETSHRLVGLPNHALVNVLKATLARLHNLEMELNKLELALDDDQKEIESYTKEIDECLDRMRDNVEFVRVLNAGEVPTVPDVLLALADMAEEREEEEQAIKQYEEARGWHEQQFQTLHEQCVTLKKERLALHKTCIEICSIFRRNGVFETARWRLAKLNSKSK